MAHIFPVIIPIHLYSFRQMKKVDFLIIQSHGPILLPSFIWKRRQVLDFLIRILALIIIPMILKPPRIITFSWKIFYLNIQISLEIRSFYLGRAMEGLTFQLSHSRSYFILIASSI